MYRDGAYFYPPLYRLVIDEWLAGRVPLWNPFANGGQPLAGSGTAGVFYPPQLVLTGLLPLGLAISGYGLFHLWLAAWGARRLAASQGCGPIPAGIAGLAYAFSGSVFGQIYNPIYLAGAAWLVWAIHAGTGLIVRPTIGSFALLSAALAMCVFCGDPQAAYHAGLVLAGYAFLPRHGTMALRNTSSIGAESSTVCGTWKKSASAQVDDRQRQLSSDSSDGYQWRRGGWLQPLLLLGMAAVVAVLLAFVQIALTLEFHANSARSHHPLPLSLWELPRFLLEPEVAHQGLNWYDGLIGRPPASATHARSLYRFSVEPWRIIEFVWPNFFGLVYQRWSPSAAIRADDFWTPSIYADVVAVILAIGGLVACRRDRRVRFWAAVGGCAMLASFGGFGPISLVRIGYSLAAAPNIEPAYQPGDEVGGLYWALATLLPGYAGFRYPGKWMPVVALAVGQLAAVSLGQLRSADVRKSVRRVAVLVAVVGGLGVSATVVSGVRHGVESVLLTTPPTNGAAPWLFTFWSGGAIAVVGSLSVLVLLWLRQHGRVTKFAFELSLGVLSAIGLTIAASSTIELGKLSDLMPPAEALRLFEKHRSPLNRSVGGAVRILSVDFDEAPTNWNSAAGYARAAGNSHTANLPAFRGISSERVGSTSLQADKAVLMSSLELPDGPAAARRTFDLAAVEWFVLPDSKATRRRWSDLLRDWSPQQQRGIFTGIHPRGPPLETFTVAENAFPVPFLLVRNQSAVARARIVRKLRPTKPPTEQSWRDRLIRLGRLAFPNQMLPDLQTTAVVEVPQTMGLSGKEFQLGTAPEPATANTVDLCKIVFEHPRRVDVEVELQAPGLFVLADTFHPDWTLRVRSNGAAFATRPVLRVNQAHRGCWLPPGHHELVFEHHSRTFAATAVPTLAAWLGLVGVAGISIFRRQQTQA